MDTLPFRLSVEKFLLNYKNVMFALRTGVMEFERKLWEQPKVCFFNSFDKDVTKKRLAEFVGGRGAGRGCDIKWKSDCNSLGNADKGVCKIDGCRIWMISTRTESSATENNVSCRKPIVFSNRRRPVDFVGSPKFVSFGFIKNKINWSLWLNKEEFYSGVVGLLYSKEDDESNYFHFWADCVSDVWYIKNSVNQKDVPSLYLMNYTGRDWQNEILEMCGISIDQVIPFNRHYNILVETLLVSVRNKGAKELPPWVCQAMRELARWEDPPEPTHSRYIYISRGDATRRRLSNEVDVKDKLKDIGFEFYTLSGFSVKEQQVLFSSAQIICAPHGAALTNIVWCRPGTTVIDIIPEKHLNPCFRELAVQASLDYHPVVVSPVSAYDKGLESDVVISEKKINEIIDVCTNLRR